MCRIPIVISLIYLTAVNVFGQAMPEVKFNHLSFVLDSHELKAVRESSFINDTLVVCETRTTKVDGIVKSSATFLYGNSNYLEFFETSGDDPNLGFLTIVFSADKISDFNKLQNHLDNAFQTEITGRERMLDNVKIPWYDALSVIDTTLIDSTFMAQCHFWFWVMMYKTEYFEYNNFAFADDELTRENYLNKYSSERKNKIIEKFSGVVMKLNPSEKEYITKFFESIRYKRISVNEYISPDNFKYNIIDRPAGDLNSIESIRFETSKNFLSKKTVEVSDNIVIIIEGNEGQISFK